VSFPRAIHLNIIMLQMLQRMHCSLCRRDTGRTEDVDEDGLHLRVRRQDLERSHHLRGHRAGQRTFKAVPAALQL